MADRTTKVTLRADVAQYTAGMKQAAAYTSYVGSEAEKLAQKREAFTTLGTAAVGFGLATVAATGMAVKAAINWETAWAGVTKTVDGSASQMAALEGELRGLATTLPATHQEIAAVAEAAGQLGVKRDDIAGFTKTMVDLGETTNLTADEAATSIAQLMNVMGTAPDQVDNLGASLVALGNDGASTERDIIQMAQRIAGAGRIIGLTEGEVMGFANALASAGIEVEAGGTAISRIMVDIAKSVSTGSDDLRGFADVAGMTATDFAKAFEERPAEAVTAFIEGLARLNATGGDVFTTLENLGQSDIRVSQALLGMANSGDMLRKSLELGNDAWKENSALQTEAEKRYQTTAAQLQILGNRVNDAAIDFGSVFLPAINDAAQVLGTFADILGGIPEPMKGIVGGMAGLAGIVALVGGAALLAVPKIAQFRIALETLGISGGKAGRMIGRGSLLFAGLAAFTVGLQGAQEELELTQQQLDKLNTARAKESIKSLDAVFKSTGGAGARGIEDFRSALEGLYTSDFFQSRQGNKAVGGFIDSLTGGIFQLSTDLKRFESQFQSMGATLAETAKTDFRSATDEFQMYVDALGGGDEAYRMLFEAMPQYRTALEEIAAQQGQNLSEQGLYNFAVGEGTLAAQLFTEQLDLTATGLEGVTEATAGSQEAVQEWLDMVAEGDAAFVDLLGAYDAMVVKNQEAAQAAADATDSTEDSWEDFIGEFPATVEGYLAELQRMVDAQNNWEQNMLLLSGRVSQGTLDELARMGPEGAPLVAELVNASDAELAKMEGLFGQRSKTATDAFANTLNSAAPVIAAAGAQLGQKTAKEIAAKLAAGTHTVEEIIAEYGLKVKGFKPQVQVYTNQAASKLQGLWNTWGSRTANWNVFVNENVNRVVTGGRGLRLPTAANGALFSYANGGIESFAGGGFPTGIYNGRAGSIHKFAEPETGWEAYISGRPGQERRNIGIAQEAIARLNARLGSYQSAPARNAASVTSSSVGSEGGSGRMVGQLFLDSGAFLGAVDGVVRSQGAVSRHRQAEIGLSL